MAMIECRSTLKKCHYLLAALGARLDTTTAWPKLVFSLSSPQEERAGERRHIAK
jgi:hypothetical protein